MKKSKYYIIRDLDELELFFKLGIVKFAININNDKLYIYNTIKDYIMMDKEILIYSKDGFWDGWDFTDGGFNKVIEYGEYSDLKSEIRKIKLEMLNNYEKE